MKKKILILAFFSLIGSVAFAQQRTQMSDFIPGEGLREYLSETEIESMRVSDPENLLRMERTIADYSLVITKLWDTEFNDMGYLDNYLPKNMSYSEADIIGKGYINPYVWKLPSDKKKYNLFKMHTSGYYVVVLPEEYLELLVKAYVQQFVF